MKKMQAESFAELVRMILALDEGGIKLADTVDAFL